MFNYSFLTRLSFRGLMYCPCFCFHCTVVCIICRVPSLLCWFMLACYSAVVDRSMCGKTTHTCSPCDLMCACTIGPGSFLPMCVSMIYPRMFHTCMFHTWAWCFKLKLCAILIVKLVCLVSDQMDFRLSLAISIVRSKRERQKELNAWKSEAERLRQRVADLTDLAEMAKGQCQCQAAAAGLGSLHLNSNQLLIQGSQCGADQQRSIPVMGELQLAINHSISLRSAGYRR